MAYNIPDKYQDLTPAPKLDNKTLNKMVWLSCFLQASFNYERMQACGWLWGILPGLQKIHTNKEDLKASMAHNLDFLNTHPFLVTFVMGIVLSLEQNKADTQTIRSVRISAAGPLGGIGDALFWLTLVPITAGLTANMAMEGQIIGAILFLIIFNVVQFVVRFGRDMSHLFPDHDSQFPFVVHPVGDSRIRDHSIRVIDAGGGLDEQHRFFGNSISKGVLHLLNMIKIVLADADHLVALKRCQQPDLGKLNLLSSSLAAKIGRTVQQQCFAVQFFRPAGTGRGFNSDIFLIHKCLLIFPL